MLEKLKEYKEIVAIIVFFLGGFMWLKGEFPSKNDLQTEVTSIRCLLDSYMRLTQLQMQVQEQEKQVASLRKKISEAPGAGQGGPPVSPAMRLEIDELKNEISAKSAKLAQTVDDMSKIRDDLARDACGKMKP